MATPPTEPYDWAVNLVNNGPIGGPNRINVPTAQQDEGWLYGEKPAYEIMNGWMYSVHLWLDYMQSTFTEIDNDTTSLQDQIDTINNTTIPNIDGTLSEDFTLGESLANGNPKYFYAETDDPTAFQSYIVLRAAPEFQEGAVIPYKWFAKDNEYQVTEYNNNEYPLDPLAYGILSEDDVKALAVEQIQNYHAANVENFVVDVTYLGNTTQGSAKTAAEALVTGQVEGDIMTVIWLKGVTVGLGNATAIESRTKVNNYTYTSGVWV